MKKVIISMMAATLMVGCSKETSTPSNDDNVISFSSSALSVDTRAALADGAVILPASSSVGIVAVTTANAATWTPLYMNNVVGTIAANGMDITYSPAQNYPAGTGTGSTLDFYAYYPQASLTSGAGAEPTIAVTQPADPTNHVDYLFATPVLAQARQATPVALTFNHALSMVRVKVQKNATMTDALTLSSITLTTATGQSGTMNVKTGAITQSGGVTSYALSGLTTTIPAQSGATTTAAVLGGANARFLYLPASTITGVSITVNGLTYALTGQTITTPVAGQALNIVVTVQPTAITLTSSVTAWTENGTDIEITPN